MPLVLNGTTGASMIQSNTVTSDKLSGIAGAVAWVRFNGTGTVAIRASYNVSGITDGGTGTYVVNLTNAIIDADYAIAGMAKFQAGAAGASAGGLIAIEVNANNTTTTIPVMTVTKDTATRIDNPDISVVAFR